MDVATLTELAARSGEAAIASTSRLLRSTIGRGWYGAYIVARAKGKSSDDAAEGAAVHVEGTHR